MDKFEYKFFEYFHHIENVSSDVDIDLRNELLTLVEAVWVGNSFFLKRSELATAFNKLNNKIFHELFQFIKEVYNKTLKYNFRRVDYWTFSSTRGSWYWNVRKSN